jgi:ferredoxin-type protein NapH
MAAGNVGGPANVPAAGGNPSVDAGNAGAGRHNGSATKKAGNKKRRMRISNMRIVTQIFGLLFGNGILIGLPLFGASNYLRHIYFPNASTKFFINAPTYSYLYKIQDTLVSGWQSMYIDLLLPLLVFLVLTLLLGRVWCAWLCPLGFPQDMLTRLRRSLGLKYIELKPHHSDFIHSLKYMGIFVVVFYSFALGVDFMGINFFRTALPVPYEWFDPNRALYLYPQMWLGLAPPTTYVPICSVLVTVLYLSTGFAVRRFWCHICPVGGLMAPFNKYAFVKLRKDPKKCTHCRICYRVCPMEILKVYEEREKSDVTSSKCIHCYHCVDNCPEEGALSVEFLGKTVRKSKFQCQCKE